MALCTSVFGQISFNGCHPLFEDQEYLFSYVETDVTGRNVYTTVPVDGAQSCSGIGICEFKIAWNSINSKWEFIADDGNGDFSSPFIVFSNPSASMPNPPSLILGAWEENNAITLGDCGGDLTASNATLTGDVQDKELSTSNNVLDKGIRVYPLPANDYVKIMTTLNINSLVIYDLMGKKMIHKYVDFEQIDISHLHSGIYFLKIITNQGRIIKKVVIE